MREGGMAIMASATIEHQRAVVMRQPMRRAHARLKPLVCIDRMAP